MSRVLRTTHMSLSGSRWPHNTFCKTAQYGDGILGREYSQNNKVVWIWLEAVIEHGAFDRVVDSGRGRVERMEWGDMGP